jgi:hypothetical protein
MSCEAVKARRHSEHGREQLTTDLEDEDLTVDNDAQLKILSQTYASDDASQIDQAIAPIERGWRMRRNGVSDLAASVSDPDDGA